MALKRVRASVFVSVFIGAAATLAVAVDVSAAESPGQSNSNYSQTSVTVANGVTVEAVTEVAQQSGPTEEASAGGSDENGADVQATASTDVSVAGFEGTVEKGEEASGDSEGGQLGSSSNVGLSSGSSEGKADEGTAGLTEEALANIKRSSEPAERTRSGFAPSAVGSTINSDSAAAAPTAISTSKGAPESPAPIPPMPIGGLGHFTALPGSTLVPSWQQFTGGEWKGAELFSEVGSASSLGVSLMLLLVLAMTGYVWRLKQAGYSSAARSDAGLTNLNIFVTPQVSFARVGTHVRGSLFSGGKRELVNLGAVGF